MSNVFGQGFLSGTNLFVYESNEDNVNDIINQALTDYSTTSQTITFINNSVNNLKTIIDLSLVSLQDNLDNSFNELKNDISNINSDFEASFNFLNNNINNAFTSLNDINDTINMRIDGVDNRINGVDNRIDGVDNRIDGVDSSLNNLYFELFDFDGSIRTTLNFIDVRSVDNKNTIDNTLIPAVNNLEISFNNLDTSINDLTNRINQTDASLGIIDNSLSLLTGSVSANTSNITTLELNLNGLGSELGRIEFVELPKKLDKAGDTMTGNLIMGNNRIQDIQDIRLRRPSDGSSMRTFLIDASGRLLLESRTGGGTIVFKTNHGSGNYETDPVFEKLHITDKIEAKTDLDMGNNNIINAGTIDGNLLDVSSVIADTIVSQDIIVDGEANISNIYNKTQVDTLFTNHLGISGFFDNTTFTPLLAFADDITTIEYIFSEGLFSRLGRFCMFSIGIKLSNKGSFNSSDIATILGLPFDVSVENQFSGVAGFQVVWKKNIAGTNVISAYANSGQKEIFIVFHSGNKALLNHGHFSNNSDIFITGQYVMRIPNTNT